MIMDDQSIKRELIDKIKRFDENITLSDGYDVDIIEKVLTENPKLMFYIAGLQIKKGISLRLKVETTVRVQYQNKDFDFNDIYAVSTISDILSLISSYIGNYKAKLGIIVDSNLNIENAFDEFREKYGAMCPNFVQAQISGCKVNGKALYKFDFSYRIGKVKLTMMENEIQSEICRISDMLFTQSMPAEAKVYLAHNYLATSVVYYGVDAISNLERSYVHSAYGALITKKCVCQGVAEAFKRLMDKAGVPCDVVCGKIIGHDDYHAWNIIKLNDKECFHIDVTWDISTGAPSFLYFGKNDAFFEKTRQWNREYNVKCQPKNNLFMMARQYVLKNRQTLLNQGIPTQVIGINLI